MVTLGIIFILGIFFCVLISYIANGFSFEDNSTIQNLMICSEPALESCRNDAKITAIPDQLYVCGNLTGRATKYINVMLYRDSEFYPIQFDTAVKISPGFFCHSLHINDPGGVEHYRVDLYLTRENVISLEFEIIDS
jgi:hypothetical protein